MKNPLTFDELLQLMKSRGLEITDEDRCLVFLSSVNYYWFSAYLLPFKQKDNTYLPGTTFEYAKISLSTQRKMEYIFYAPTEDVNV